MTFLDLILARSADDDWIKVVFGVIVAIIWGLGALVSAVNNKAQDAKRRQQYGRLPVDVAKPTSPRARGAVVRGWRAPVYDVTPRALVLRVADEGYEPGELRFYSSEAADPALRPRLRITYVPRVTFGQP